MATCDGTTKGGRACRANAVPGSTRCKAHSGDSDVGRRSALTDEVATKILHAVRAGAYVEQAAEHAGVHRSTVYRWLRASEAEGAPPELRAFREDFDRASADAEVGAIAAVRAAMPDDWRAGIAFLERRFPERWRRRTSLEHTGGDGGPIEFIDDRGPLDLSRLSDEELAQLEAINAKLVGNDG